MNIFKFISRHVIIIIIVVVYNFKYKKNTALNNLLISYAMIISPIMLVAVQ